MKTIGIYANPSKALVWEVLSELTSLLEASGVPHFLDSVAARHLDKPEIGLELKEFHHRVDLAFVLGGDGTLLGVARTLAPFQIPLLGINLGHLGFLTEAEPEDLMQSVHQILGGQYEVDQRMMLESRLYREGRGLGNYFALNDVGVAKGSFSRMVVCTVYVNDSFLGTYSGDGILFSSPTGSTGYALSAGGPIISPHVEAILFTPIAPHTLTARPIVVAPDATIRVIIESDHEDIGLTMDGQLGIPLQPKDVVTIKKSPYSTQLIKWKTTSFFEVVREKLQVQRGEELE